MVVLNVDLGRTILGPANGDADVGSQADSVVTRPASLEGMEGRTNLYQLSSLATIGLIPIKSRRVLRSTAPDETLARSGSPFRVFWGSPAVPNKNRQIVGLHVLRVDIAAFHTLASQPSCSSGRCLPCPPTHDHMTANDRSPVIGLRSQSSRVQGWASGRRLHPQRRPQASWKPYGSANTQITPPCGTCTSYPGMMPRRTSCLRSASTPQPD